MAFANVPMEWVGPIKLQGDLNEEISLPLATFETPLFASTARGAKLSRLTHGITVTLLSSSMTRSIALEGPDTQSLRTLEKTLNLDLLNPIVLKTSRFAKLINIQTEILGKLIYIRLVFSTGDASGHNMATQAAEAVLNFLLEQNKNLRYLSISGNICCDKKTSAINSLLGRGKSVMAEIFIERSLCEKYLKTSPEKIIELNTKKNLLGSILAGSLRSANAHFANILLGAYLATGQDAANIVEGSQGISFAELALDPKNAKTPPSDGLYFCIKCPNLILGTVGNGKDLTFVQENLKKLGCLEPRDYGKNSERLAMIIAAAVLCCELSLLAAQTNPGELMRAHHLLERQANKNMGQNK